MRIVLVENHAILRQGLKALLEENGVSEVVGEAENGEEAVALAKSLRPDAMILDVSMPRLNGIDAARLIRVANPTIKLIMLSSYSNHGLVFDALKAAYADGTLDKDLCTLHMDNDCSHVYAFPDQRASDEGDPSVCVYAGAGYRDDVWCEIVLNAAGIPWEYV